MIITFYSILWWFSTSKTPVPIPNTAVKTLYSDNTYLERDWEDSLLPRYIISEYPC